MTTKVLKHSRLVCNFWKAVSRCSICQCCSCCSSIVVFPSLMHHTNHTDLLHHADLNIHTDFLLQTDFSLRKVRFGHEEFSSFPGFFGPESWQCSLSVANEKNGEEEPDDEVLRQNYSQLLIDKEILRWREGSHKVIPRHRVDVY